MLESSDTSERRRSAEPVSRGALVRCADDATVKSVRERRCVMERPEWPVPSVDFYERKARTPMRAMAIVNMKFHKGKLFVSGVSNQEFCPALWRILSTDTLRTVNTYFSRNRSALIQLRRSCRYSGCEDSFRHRYRPCRTSRTRLRPT